jgi:hypothetical protein
MRLVGAEFLKLRKRTGLVLASFAVTVVPALIMLAVSESGGVRAFADQLGVVTLLTVVAAILVGATLGTADVTCGVFRDLVVTGRSRSDLYAARVPAGLTLVLAVAAAGFAVVTASAGSAASADLIATSAAWLALVAATAFALALGVASFVGSAGSAIATLLALWLVVTPLVQNLASLAWLRDWLVISGLDRVMPAALVEGDPVSRLSLAGAIVVLVAWTAVPLAAGAWRTVTRDA